MLYNDESPDGSFSEILGSNQWSPNTKNNIKQSKLWIKEGMEEVRLRDPLPKHWMSTFNKNDDKDTKAPNPEAEDDEIINDITRELRLLLEDDDEISDLPKKIGELVEGRPTKEILKNHIDDLFQNELIENVARHISNTPHAQEVKIKTERKPDILLHRSVRPHFSMPLTQHKHLVEHHRIPTPCAQSHQTVLTSSRQHLQLVAEFTNQERIPEINDIERRFLIDHTRIYPSNFQRNNEITQLSRSGPKKRNFKPHLGFVGMTSDGNLSGNPRIMNAFVLNPQMSTTSRGLGL